MMRGMLRLPTIMIDQYQQTDGIYSEADAIAAGWTKAPDSVSIYHQHSSGNESNSKFWGADGHSKLVFDRNGNTVSTTENRGTYNYGAGTGAEHFVKDVAPYWMLGGAVVVNGSGKQLILAYELVVEGLVLELLIPTGVMYLEIAGNEKVSS